MSKLKKLLDWLKINTNYNKKVNLNLAYFKKDKICEFTKNK